MDQKSNWFAKAKNILNNQNPSPYSDNEVNEIIQLLEIFTDVLFNNIIQNK
ncbi:hypothetical protein Q4Q39_07025 [Flavivirga amylovorans]|uniref:Uncharacterized protein n=1 Tax=Flavivirga amylovorans TaxID=870486 RepID=A0ABT8X0J3_9FLAO|nr:hypothetical protein [Flavivirga amylovorans]MDO5987144.1 hypothetical protein [Flavivirga amylovorans]